MGSLKSKAPEALGVRVDVAFVDWLEWMREESHGEVTIHFARTLSNWSFFTPYTLC